METGSGRGGGHRRLLRRPVRPGRHLPHQIHHLVWLPPVVVAVYLLRKRLPKWVVNGSLTVAGVLFCGVYLYRLLSGCAPEVVAFAPETGAVVRLGAALLARRV